MVTEVGRHTYQPQLCYNHIHGLVQGCSNSIANALELLQSCTKPSIYNKDVQLQGLASIYTDFSNIFYTGEAVGSWGLLQHKDNVSWYRDSH